MLDWTGYEIERRRKGTGTALTEADRQALEQMLVNLLGLSASDAARTWGAVVGYGRDADGVVRLEPGVPHRFSAGEQSVAVKVYRGRKPRFVQWHGRLFRSTPGLLGHSRVQQSLAAGDAVDGHGVQRSYAVVQYLPGVVLEAWLPEQQPMPIRAARSCLEQILGLVIDLWGASLRTWDLRPGNLIIDPDSGRVALVDTDSYQNLHEEVTLRPHDWSVRDRFEASFFERLPGNLVFQVLTGRKKGGNRADQRELARIEQALADSGLKAALRVLGRPGSQGSDTTRARQACAALLDGLTG
jgi:hypothetical protein